MYWQGAILRETSSSGHADPVPSWSSLPQHGLCRKLLGAKTVQGAAPAFGLCVTAQTARRVNIEDDVLPDPCAQKRINLPTACWFRYNMLLQGSDSVGESSHVNVSTSTAHGTALLQKVAPENWFQRMNVVISMDESLCQGGHHDANSQSCAKLSLAACTACAFHGVGTCLMPDESKAQWHLQHEPKGCAWDAGCRMRTIVHDLLGPYGGVQVDGQAHGREDDQKIRLWYFLPILVTLFACCWV